MMGGRFHFIEPGKPPLVLPNIFMDQGEQSFLEILFQSQDIDVPLNTGIFYLGLCGNLVVDETSGLVDITDEVAELSGYARQPLNRDVVGWPTVEAVGVRHRAVSQQVTFTATGGDFDRTFTRAFLSNASTGSSGVLYAFSAPLPVPFLLTDGNSYNIIYEFYLR